MPSSQRPNSTTAPSAETDRANFAGESRLAHTGLAGEQSHAAVASSRRLPARLEATELSVAPDKAEALDNLHRRGQGDESGSLDQVVADGERGHRLANPLERELAERLELETATRRNEGPYKIGDQELPGLGHRAETGRHDHRHAKETSVVSHDRVAGLHTDSKHDTPAPSCRPHSAWSARRPPASSSPQR